MTKFYAIFALLGPLCFALGAHNGPPFPIIVDKRVGPAVIALWTHPDIGVGSFWVIVDPPPGGKLPDDLSVELAIQPVSARIPEARYPGKRDNSSAQVQFKVEAPFDRQEFINVRVLLKSSSGSGVAAASVEVTPVGYGRWDLLFYLAPFLCAGFLWFRAMTRRRRR